MRKTSFGQINNKLLERILYFLRTRFIIRELKSSNKALNIADLGCGYNAQFLTRVTKNLADKINKGVGLDLSINEQLNDKKINLIVSDLNEKLPLSNGEFDIVFSTAVLEHLKNPDQALKEMHRILNDNGKLILTTPSPLAKPILEFLAYKMKLIDEQEVRDHKNYFSKKELKRTLAEAGFVDINIKSFQFGLNNLAICKK